MRKGLLVIIATLFFIGVNGQDLDWMLKSGSVSVPNNNISVDAFGNTYLVATASSSLNADPGSSSAGFVALSPSGGQEAFLVKYDSYGNFLWVRIMNSSMSSAVQNFSVDGDGNCYVTGYFKGSIDFDSNITTDNLTDYTSNFDPFGSGFLAKYDSNGNFLWSEVSDGEVKAVSNNEFLLYGNYDASKDFDFGNGTHFESVFDSVGGVFVANYDGLANLISVKTISDGEKRNVSWADEMNGEIYLSGHEYETDTVLVDTNIWIKNVPNCFIGKYNVVGNLDWKRLIGDEGRDQLTSCVLDDLGNVYVAGNFQNTVDFNPGGISVNLTSVGNRDIFLSKYNSAGINEWAYNISDQLDTSTSLSQGWPPNMILSMTYVSQEGVLVSGQHYSELEVNHNGGMVLLPDVDGQGAFVMNFDESGNYNFGKTIAGLSSSEVHGHGVAADDNGNFYLSGHFYGFVDFDLGVGVYNNFSNSQGLFLAKYSFNAVSIEENDFASDFSLYPNPASNNLNIDFDNQEEFVSLQIVNVHGQQILSKEYQNIREIRLDVNDFVPGFYFIKINVGSGHKTIKFSKL